MTVLLTGVAGFIGYHVASALLNRGDEVVGIDDLNPYYDPALKRARLARLTNPNFSFHHIDISGSESVERSLRNHNISRIIHLAAQPGVRNPDPQSYVRSNLVGHTNMLEIARQHAAPMVYASSSSVYGSNPPPFGVGDRTDAPLSFYAATKKANELASESYAHVYGLPLTGLRFFTTYGPWGRPDMAIWKFTDSILHGQPVPLYNHAQMARDFTYVDDVVSGVIAAVDQPPVGRHTIYNVGGGSSCNLMRLVDLLEDACGKTAIRDFQPRHVADPVETCADITETRKELGFDPQITIEDGITRFVNWFKSSQI